MPRRVSDLHGNAPDHSPVVLLLIDVINDFNYPGGRELLRHARPVFPRIAKLKQRAKLANVPVIYVNDNLGKWKSDFRRVVDHCCSAQSHGPQAEQRQQDTNPVLDATGHAQTEQGKRTQTGPVEEGSRFQEEQHQG